MRFPPIPTEGKTTACPRASNSTVLAADRAPSLSEQGSWTPAGHRIRGEARGRALRLPSADKIRGWAEDPVAPVLAAPEPPRVLYAMPPPTASVVAHIRKWVVTFGVLGMLLVTVSVIVLILALVPSR